MSVGVSVGVGVAVAITEAVTEAVTEATVGVHGKRVVGLHGGTGGRGVVTAIA